MFCLCEWRKKGTIQSSSDQGHYDITIITVTFDFQALLDEVCSFNGISFLFCGATFACSKWGNGKNFLLTFVFRSALSCYAGAHQTTFLARTSVVCCPHFRPSSVKLTFSETVKRIIFAGNVSNNHISKPIFFKLLHFWFRYDFLFVNISPYMGVKFSKTAPTPTKVYNRFCSTFSSIRLSIWRILPKLFKQIWNFKFGICNFRQYFISKMARSISRFVIIGSRVCFVN